MLAMARKRRFKAIAGIDPAELASFQTAIRKRYSDEQILEELDASAKRLGRSPTMREFAADPGTRVHPQTVIEHFGTWNAAKRAAGLVPRRFATREELLDLLRELGDKLGRIPTARDIEEHRGRMPSKSLYWHTFGSLANALREAGFDVPVGEERLERALEQGVKLARRGAHCLRHACASQLLDAGFTLKQIADHLGHRSMDTTRIYTKIDLHGLRQVAEIDLGALL